MSGPLETTDLQPRRVARAVTIMALLGVAVGAAATAVGLRTDPAGAWRGLFINFLFWGSLAQGAVVWSVAFRIARTTWSASINRMGHAFVPFLPVGVVLFAALSLGRGFLLPWLGMPLGDRGWWLNAPFLWVRDGGALVLLWILSAVFVRTYRRADRPGADAARADHRLSVVGVVLLFAYGWLWSLLGFDLVQSLTQPWHSALFGWYFAVGGLYLGMAALIVTAAATRTWLGVRGEVGRGQFLDLGNLLLACAMVMTYFMFSQALPIWYGNLPPETGYPILRVHFQPWQTLCWVLLFTGYLGVFALLVIREMKERAATLTAVALLALAAMWLERYLLVMPSLGGRGTACCAPTVSLLLAPGFLGVLVLVVSSSLARHPAPSPLDLALKAEQEAWL